MNIIPQNLVRKLNKIVLQTGPSKRIENIFQLLCT